MRELRLRDTSIDTYVACPCGRTDPAGAADEHGTRTYTCGGCGTVYELSWAVTVQRVPNAMQTGKPDLLVHLRQSVIKEHGPDDGEQYYVEQLAALSERKRETVITALERANAGEGARARAAYEAYRRRQVDAQQREE